MRKWVTEQATAPGKGRISGGDFPQSVWRKEWQKLPNRAGQGRRRTGSGFIKTQEGSKIIFPVCPKSLGLPCLIHLTGESQDWTLDLTFEKQILHPLSHRHGPSHSTEAVFQNTHYFLANATCHTNAKCHTIWYGLIIETSWFAILEQQEANKILHANL